MQTWKDQLLMYPSGGVVLEVVGGLGKKGREVELGGFKSHELF